MLGLGLKVRGCFWTGLDRESEDQTVSCLSPGSGVRLEGGDGRCAGRVEMKHQGEWRRLSPLFSLDLGGAAVVCRQLDCGSAVSTRGTEDEHPVWMFISRCVGSEPALRECGTVDGEYPASFTLEVNCSGNTHIMFLYSADDVGSHTLLSLILLQ